ncbi:putative RNA-directed DNA polymerase, eukaryota, reverse transcriptase zinc-binding domain protein, partial [Tanacetum coccineum]
EVSGKRILWDYLSYVIGRWNGELIVMGDFNEGYAFTWSHPTGAKMSKLDRFLISDGILQSFPSIAAICLDRHLSDHRPILLREAQLDFGPTPFRFYHSWFDYVGFDDLIKTSWLSFSHSDIDGMTRFKKKLQDLKVIIRRWVKSKRLEMSGSKSDIVTELAKIDRDMEGGLVDDGSILRRLNLKNNLLKITEMEAKDRIQKSKVKWAVEGDENSKFFHGILNKRRSHLAIRGIFVDGIWRSDPTKIKNVFVDHFEGRFKEPTVQRLKLNFQFPRKLLISQADDLEREVSREEIRRAVWNCGDNKSPGPDGYTFEFFKKYWDLLGSDFCGAVESFFVTGDFSKGCNSSFVTLIPKVTDAKFVNDFRPISLIGCIYKVVTKVLANRLVSVIGDLVSDSQTAFVAGRQILDGPFILDEILNWCKRTRNQAMFFKVDFAKAYDSVRWDYLLDILEAFGFGHVWCNWIRGTLRSSKASILINGSPSNEFYCYRGLKQGDPLAPYLFILIMESLHLSFSRVVDQGFFKGIQLPGQLSISHLFYADDAMFIGEWSDENLKGLVQRLLFPGLFSKFLLELKVMESIRARFFNGADQLDNKIAWVAWDKVLASKKNGGLGVSSFFTLNRALLLKWVWREVHKLKGKGFDFWSHVKKRIGNGADTRFWSDQWLGDSPLFLIVYPTGSPGSESRFYGVFVSGGTYLRQVGIRFKIGSLGFFGSGFPTRLNLCWKALSMLLGGRFGADVIRLFHGRTGLKTLILFPCNVFLASC